MKAFGKKIAAVACAAAMAVSVGILPAFAANQDFVFSITSGNSVRFDTTTTPATKDDNDSYWYFTPKSGNWNGYNSRTWVYVIPDQGGGTPSGYHNVEAYQLHKMKYHNWVPSAGSKLRCELKEEKYGIRYTMRGTWCP